MAKTAQTKGVYNLNPTKMIMKQGSEQERRELQRSGPVREDGPRMSEAHESSADSECIECGDMSHPMMQTRHSHPANQRHSDGRLHEDDHHAVRKMKGMI